MKSDTPEIPRPLPNWAWALSVLLLPYGVFIAYGFARLLAWPRSIALATTSFICVNTFVALMIHLDSIHASGLAHVVGVDAGMLMFMGWFYLLYRIGKDASYWSPALLRGWRRAGWLAIALCFLCVINIALEVVLRHFAR